MIIEVESPSCGHTLLEMDCDMCLQTAQPFNNPIVDLQHHNVEVQNVFNA